MGKWVRFYDSEHIWRFSETETLVCFKKKKKKSTAFPVNKLDVSQGLFRGVFLSNDEWSRKTSK